MCEDKKIVFGITFNTLVQCSSELAGCASDSYWLGRGAEGPDSRGTTTAARALRVNVYHLYVQSCSATVTDRERRDGVTGGPESVRDGSWM